MTKFNKVIKDISNQHRKIIDEWCKAFLAKEYEIGNSIHPGCFTIEQREINESGHFGYEYMIKPNDQNLGVRLNWKSKEEEFPPHDGTKFLAYVSICVKENIGHIPGTFKNNYKICWFEDGFWRSDDKDQSFQILQWIKIPEPKKPKWKQLNLCCEIFFENVDCEEDVYTIENITEVLKFCPWCGRSCDKNRKINNE